jgi:hypothetical protein
MRGDGLFKCARKCMVTKKGCRVKSCKHFINYEAEYNCCLVSVYENGKMTLREVGDRIGVSFARVKQIQDGALKKLRKHPDISSFKF